MQTGHDGASGLTPDLIKPGTPVAVDGPLGSFTFPDHPRERRFVFIAGGTGIAPLRSMLWHALLAERDGHVGLIYSVRSPDEFAYMEEFQQLEDEGRIDFRHTVTRAASEGWTGRQGRIDASCLEDLIVPGETLCFLCGPPALVGEIPPQLKQMIGCSTRIECPLEISGVRRTDESIELGWIVQDPVLVAILRTPDPPSRH